MSRRAIGLRRAGELVTTLRRIVVSLRADDKTVLKRLSNLEKRTRYLQGLENRRTIDAEVKKQRSLEERRIAKIKVRPIRAVKERSNVSTHDIGVHLRAVFFAHGGKSVDGSGYSSAVRTGGHLRQADASASDLVQAGLRRGSAGRHHSDAA
jgi:hypothetical protein